MNHLLCLAASATAILFLVACRAPAPSVATPRTTAAAAASGAGAGGGRVAESAAPPWEAARERAVSDRDRRAVVAALCEGRPTTAKGDRTACACPSFTELPGDATELEIGNLISGAFSEPRADEVLAATLGCETGAGSNHTYGGRALLRRTTRGFERVHYAPGALGACRAVPSPGRRTFAVCELESGQQGTSRTTYTKIAFEDVAGHVEARDQEIVDLHSHAGGPGGAAEPLYRVRVTRHALIGAAAYEAGDAATLALVIEVRTSVTCDESPHLCAGIDGAAREASLLYRFDGRSFALAPESAAAYAAVKARDRE
ncbi:MAG TPA: hypothetical protein VGM56_19810 [Byssovorax sp.]